MPLEFKPKYDKIVELMLYLAYKRPGADKYTTKAIGHERRWKYHVYICEADWRAGHTFLFISKADYGGDYKITKADYPFFALEFSYVSCGSIVCYRLKPTE